MVLLVVVDPLVFVPTSFLLLLFADGRLPSPRWRPVAWCAGLGIIGSALYYALDAGPLEDYPQLVNPYGVNSPIVGIVGVAASFVAMGSTVASAASVIVRLRRAGRVERQQIKWLAYGGAVVVGTIFVGGAISFWSDTVGIAVISLSLLGLPICTGIAIVRYRLYDIDLLINRTLVYAVLTATLALIYFGGVATVQAIFRALTGQEHQPQLAVVVSTLVIATLFNPLRRRIQGFIDRRFYRRKYDAAKTLEAFSAQAEKRDRPRRTERRSGGGGEGDHATRPRLAVVAPRSWPEGQDEESSYPRSRARQLGSLRRSIHPSA